MPEGPPAATQPIGDNFGSLLRNFTNSPPTEEKFSACEGRISRNLNYYDAASIMRHVGLLPTEKTDQQNDMEE